jgi:hypothetical protein
VARRRLAQASRRVPGWPPRTARRRGEGCESLCRRTRQSSSRPRPTVRLASLTAAARPSLTLPARGTNTAGRGAGWKPSTIIDRRSTPRAHLLPAFGDRPGRRHDARGCPSLVDGASQPALQRRRQTQAGRLSGSPTAASNGGASGTPRVYRCFQTGDDRNRTGVHGFAGRCVATPPRRQSARP